jgi:hypothetical protein
MKYLLFVFDDYYAEGGWNDFHGAFASIADVKLYLIEERDKRAGGQPPCDNAQIVDIESKTVVWESEWNTVSPEDLSDPAD